MNPAKRALDLALAITLAALLALPLLVLMGVLLIREGRPVFYVAERMTDPDTAFGLVKLRTMRPDPEGARATGVTGGDKAARMSGLHRALRASRLDEIPQLWNVIRGEMSLVGPRPPLRVYVEAFPDLYARVLQSRPGITGLASLTYHAHEERLLAGCRDAAETDAVYRRRCVPRKAHIDLLYQENRNICLDLIILGRTALKPLRGRH